MRILGFFKADIYKCLVVRKYSRSKDIERLNVTKHVLSWTFWTKIMIALCQASASQGMREMLLGIFSIFSSDLALTYSYTLASLCRDKAIYAVHSECWMLKSKCQMVVGRWISCLRKKYPFYPGWPDLRNVLSINQGGAMQCRKEHFC